MSDIVNTMWSGATAEVTNILSGPAWDFIYFGLGVFVISIWFAVYRKFGWTAKG